MTKASTKKVEAVPDVSYCYVREKRTDRGSHRIACIALKKAALGYYYLSYYIHNPKRGAFSPKYARATAIGRLKSEKVQRVFHDLFDAHHVTNDKLSDRVFTKTNMYTRFITHPHVDACLDNDRNDRAIRGALLELEPRKVPYPAVR